MNPWEIQSNMDRDVGRLMWRMQMCTTFAVIGIACFVAAELFNVAWAYTVGVTAYLVSMLFVLKIHKTVSRLHTGRRLDPGRGDREI